MGPSSLPLDLGGGIAYDKVGWVSQRVEVEAFHSALQTLSRELKAFTESFQDLETPNDPSSTEALISGKHTEFQRLRVDLTQSVEYGEHLLFRIKDMTNSSMGNSSPERTPRNDQGKNHNISNGNGKNHSSKNGGNKRSSQQSSVQLINVISVERYIIQIEETARLFEDFWMKEKLSLERCLQLRRFEHDFREMQVCKFCNFFYKNCHNIFEARISFMHFFSAQATFHTGMKRLEEFGEVGESLAGTEALIRETSEFELLVTEDVNRAQELEEIGREIAESNQSAVDSVTPKCIELSRMRTQFLNCLREKIAIQMEWRDVQAVIERVSTSGRNIPIVTFILHDAYQTETRFSCFLICFLGKRPLRRRSGYLLNVSFNIGPKSTGSRGHR